MRDYLKFWRHYLDFKGHSSVSEFCNAFLWYIITGFVIVILSGIVLIGCFSMSAERASDLSLTFISIFGRIALLPCIAITVRRLRDAGYSPRTFLWLLVPGIGMIAFLVRLFSKSASHTTNK